MKKRKYVKRKAIMTDQEIAEGALFYMTISEPNLKKKKALRKLMQKFRQIVES